GNGMRRGLLLGGCWVEQPDRPVLPRRGQDPTVGPKCRTGEAVRFGYPNRGAARDRIREDDPAVVAARRHTRARWVERDTQHLAPVPGENGNRAPRVGIEDVDATVTPGGGEVCVV